MRARLFVILGFVVVGSLVVACKPKAGQGCKIERKEACIDEKKALACQDGKWEEMPCRGSAGCSKLGKDEVCDQTAAEKEDVCNLVGDFVCTADKEGMLECSKNKWTFVQTCLGERGCTMEAKKVSCDNSIANASEACRQDEDYACSPDKKAALVCRGKQFVHASLCKGPKGCRVTGDKSAGFKVECDDSVAAIGDACEKEEHFSCATDERSILKCKHKKFELDEKCRAKEKCQTRGGQVGCY